MTLASCTFRNNTAPNAIVDDCNNTAPNAIVDDCNTTKTVYGTGGVINNIGATIIATDTIFSDNNSGGLGGAITSDGFASFVGCDFIGNTAHGAGGAINIKGVGAFFDKCKFIGNTGRNNAGGAIYASAEMTVKSTLFKCNSAFVGGAVVHFLNGKLSMDDVEFSANRAAAGGGLGLLASVSDLNNCRFHQNTLRSDGGSGGAIVYAAGDEWPNNTATLSDTVFQSNLPVNASSVDIYNSYPSTVACSGNCFCNAAINSNGIDISTNNLTTTCAGDGVGPECPGCNPSASPIVCDGDNLGARPVDMIISRAGYSNPPAEDVVGDLMETLKEVIAQDATWKQQSLEN